MTTLGGGLQVELEAAAEDLQGIEASPTPSGMEWSLGNRVFAAISDDRAEFWLDPAVASAARRTPDTGPSTRGPDWVAFSPGALDDHAIDRAVAWLASAWRRAREG